MARKKRKKTGFHTGDTARLRTMKSWNAIREALSHGDTTFGNIMKETKLSTTALASNLKKLEERGDIKRRTDQDDRRLKNYSLTEEGWREIYKRTLGNIMEVIGEQMAEILAVAVEVLVRQQSKQDRNVLLPQLNANGVNLFQVILTGEMYALTASNERTGFIEPLKNFLTEIKMASEGKLVDIEPIKNLCNIFFVFELKKERFIELVETIKKSKNYEDFKAAATAGK